jgi:hypothetical protein
VCPNGNFLQHPKQEGTTPFALIQLRDVYTDPAAIWIFERSFIQAQCAFATKIFVHSDWALLVGISGTNNPDYTKKCTFVQPTAPSNWAASLNDVFKKTKRQLIFSSLEVPEVEGVVFPGLTKRTGMWRFQTSAENAGSVIKHWGTSPTKHSIVI